MTSACANCCEIKPKFFKTPVVNLIKSLQPFERLSMDFFKGPLPLKPKIITFLLLSISFHDFFLFSRVKIPVNSRTVISCLNSLFNLFDFPAIVHSDNAKCFVSKETKQFLNKREIASYTHS